jgi:hypothetical protein
MKYGKNSNLMLLAGLLAWGLAGTQARAQSTAPATAATPAAPAAKAAAPAAKPVAPAAASYRNPQNRMDARAERFYGLVWGIDSLSVKLAESGEIVRFSYRVVDADKAKIVADKKSTPSLVDPQAGVKLVVPELEQVGMLRQSSTPEAGKSYWMAFSNSGRVVKRGDRVNVVIGLFRANGLIVE